MARTFKSASPLLLVAVLAFASPALAQGKHPDLKQLNERQPRSSNKEPSHRKPCPEYGAGFYRLDGSDTCMRLGGSIDMTVGSGRANAPTR